MDDDRELSKELTTLEQDHAVLKQEMQTMHADYKTALAELKTDMAKRDTEAARRDKDNLRWQIGLWASAAIVIIGGLGFFMNILIRTGGAVPGA